MNIKWIREELVHAAHRYQITLFGGSHGLRDQGLLRSALDRPRNKYHYESCTDLFELAAAYGYGIARNHPFVDGNKRAAYVVMETFLRIHGMQIVVSEDQRYDQMIALASGNLSEGELASWLKSAVAPLQ